MAVNTIVTYGEALVDMIEMSDGRFAAALGGSVCNFTLACARQALPVTYLNPLSFDSFGNGFARLLADAGVTLASAQRSSHPTSLAIVTLDASKSPSYAFHRDGVADRDITPRQACALLPAGTRLFHTGGLTLLPTDLDNTRQIISAAAATGALISIDANMRPLASPDLASYAAGVRRTLALAQLIKVSEEDLVHLGFGELAPLDAARQLLAETDVSLIALTLGADGAVLLSRSVSVSVKTPAGLVVADTVGCGDCFMAGLVQSLGEAGLLTPAALAGADAATLEQAGRRAVATASLNATREGCNPPTAAEVTLFLRGAATAHGARAASSDA
ncbi:carbohydrate kinase [Oxalobacteraceae bacterium]|nr:carbohydrate kinase [Oxalobacteraceae bacterium]